MCGRFTVGIPQDIEKRFKTANRLGSFKPSWNVAPGQAIPTITRNSPNRITLMKWGLIWSKKASFGTINLRRESFQDKPFFRHFLVEKRCLIVADSFYEWGEVNLEGKTEKYPFNFYLKGRSLFGFAGVYSDLGASGDKTLYTCAIITCAPNNLVKKIHHRMPVILAKKDEESWLDPENKDINQLVRLLVPYRENGMAMRLVSKRVNNPGNNDPSLVEEIKL